MTMDSNRLHENDIEIRVRQMGDETYYVLVLPSKYAGNRYEILTESDCVESARAERRQLIEFLREWGLIK